MSTPTPPPPEPEAEGPGHFCWIRIVKIDAAAQRTPSRVKVVETPWTRDEKRPPPKIRSIGPVPGGGTLNAWTAEEECFGRDNADTVFEYGPAFQYRSLAEAWIQSKEGIEWDLAAANRMLISFDPALGSHEDMLEAASDCLPNPALTGFPDECWEPELKYRWKTPPTPARDAPGGTAEEADTVFLGTAMTLKPTENYRQLPPPLLYGPGAPQKGPDESLVLAEAHGAARVIDALLQRVNIHTDKPPMNLALKKARTELMNRVERVVYRLKVKHNRPRPWMIFENYLPMFHGKDWRNPRHPAYPSGHAVTAALWAHLLADRYPAQAQSLKVLARQIAQRRVDAGLHFQDDCDDGLKLGEQMADEVLKRFHAGTLVNDLPLFDRVFRTLPA